jgi:hypothetical protein
MVSSAGIVLIDHRQSGKRVEAARKQREVGTPEDAKPRQKTPEF